MTNSQGLKKLLSSHSGQVEFPARQETFHPNTCLKIMGPGKWFVVKKVKLIKSCWSKENLRAACPKGKLESSEHCQYFCWYNLQCITPQKIKASWLCMRVKGLCLLSKISLSYLPNLALPQCPSKSNKQLK